MCVFVCLSRVVPCSSWPGVRCGGVCLGLGCCRALPLLAGVLGPVCVCVRAPLVPRPSWLGCAVWACVLRSGFGCAPLLGKLLGCVCVGAWAPLAPPPSWGAACGVGVCGCCRGWGLPPPPPLPFAYFRGGRRGVSCRAFVVLVASCPGLGSRGLRPPFPSCSGCAFLCFFFLRPSVVCVRMLGVSLLPVGRCSWFGGAGFGWVVLRCPFWGSCLRCRLAGGFGRLLRCGWAFSWLWAFLVPPPPVFFFGGGVPVPPSAFPGLVHALVGIRCGLPGCCWCLRFARPCPGPMGRVGYVHVGLGGPSCRVRFWLCRLGGCARRLLEALG